MSAILEVTDLRKSYAGVHALDGVSLAVEAGSITGLIGPNGSGKSSLMRLQLAWCRSSRLWWSRITSTGQVASWMTLCATLPSSIPQLGHG